VRIKISPWKDEKMKESETYDNEKLTYGCHMLGVSGKNPRSFMLIGRVVVKNELK
jgi:hypothetical protein